MEKKTELRRFRGIVFAVLGLPCVLGCQQNMMREQPKFKPYEESAFFRDGSSARPLVPGTVPRGHLRDDAHFYAGRAGKNYAEALPFPVTRAVLLRGQERFNIYCAVCHDRAGTGAGMIVRRGFPQPPSYHIDRLRKAPAGYFFDVMTNGFGRMQDYSAQVNPQDRWAIVAYIRALQLSQNAALSDVPEDERRKLFGRPQ